MIKIHVNNRNSGNYEEIDKRKDLSLLILKPEKESHAYFSKHFTRYFSSICIALIQIIHFWFYFLLS